MASIVAAGTHTTHGYQRSSGFVWARGDIAPVFMGGPVTTTQQSSLARALAFPAPPRPGSTMGCLAAVLVAVGALLTAFGVLAVAVDDDDGAETPEEAREQSDDEADNPVADAVGTALAVMVFGGAPLVTGVVLAWSARQRRQRWQRQLAHWQRAAPVAQRLWYCARDHVVYDPWVPGAVVPPEQAAGYAYQQAAPEAGPP